ncbi:uncharacterized protein ASCRUDRAFT_36932 [Ascoidea rubescens DSM 1968]|uniref:WD40 repeat-like protein n=1 Tax=Ascoidea rubescens DSM 1968 TaxID=1344418 RepID=A0A1D2VEH1_9ASCO|nr:hypothetical protein ASCRUDRAFT_36932 [Ascoidea rubescens DSM 1968]ODV59867.1 hypothetical protein ASCRUDRAFT_36932 [Ascoidea rubescens DSM 1968]
MFYAIKSEIFILGINEVTGLPLKHPLLRFNTIPYDRNNREQFMRDRLAAINYSFPYSINCLKVSTFLDREVLAVTTDDGRILIWFTDILLERSNCFIRDYIDKKANDRLKNLNSFSNSPRINLEFTDQFNHSNTSNKEDLFHNHPNFQLRVGLSAWSIDFHNKYNMIAVGDNSKTITLFYLATEHSEATFYAVTTNELMHNIPDISFINNDEEDDDDEYYDDDDDDDDNEYWDNDNQDSNSDEKNSGSFTNYENGKKKNIHSRLKSSPVSHNIDEKQKLFQKMKKLSKLKFSRVKFSTPIIISRQVLDEDGWTVNTINKKYFKKVSSLNLLLGDTYIDQSELIQSFLKKSEILDGESDPMVSDDLGISKNLHFFNRKRKKTYKSINGKKYWQPIAELNNEFQKHVLLVTTKTRLGIFNPNKLICNAGTNSIFSFNIDENNSLLEILDVDHGGRMEELTAANRISISILIPDLSAIVIATQSGVISVFRLTTFRGLYGFRQELIFPNVYKTSIKGHGMLKSISGLAVRKVGFSDSYVDLNDNAQRKNGIYSQDKYFIYVTYINGETLCYEIYAEEDKLILNSLII